MSTQQSLIPRSIKVDGRYVSTDDKRVSYTSEAWLSVSHPKTLDTLKLQVRPERDISNALASANILKVRDVLVEYEGGDVSAVVPIADVIIEHRANMGVAAIRGSTADASKFPTGYMVTYASVGIPVGIYNVIMSKLRSAVAGKVKIELDKAQHNDGYVWFPTKLPNPIKLDRGNITNNKCMTTVYVYTKEEGSQEAGDLLTYMRAVGQSILCYATIAMRLKHTRRKTAPDNNVYQLATTLVGVQAIDITSLSCPPLNMQAGAALVNVEASSRLMHAMTSGGRESDSGEEEEEAEEEGEDDKKAGDSVDRK